MTTSKKWSFYEDEQILGYGGDSPALEEFVVWFRFGIYSIYHYYVP